MSKSLNANGKGMAPFTFGKDYRPDMRNDEANILSQVDRLSLAFHQKFLKDESILESTITVLKETAKTKQWSNTQTGQEFGQLINREPNQLPAYNDAYYDDYDGEDYGEEDYFYEQPQH